MPIDFQPASRHRFLVLYDPSALPLDFPIDPNLEKPEPDPPPDAAVRALSWEGRGFVIEVPSEADCEATVRVFINEDPPADLIKKGGRTIRETLLSLPGGTLRADGSEFMCLPGQKRKHGDGDAARVTAGDYLLTIYELVHWKRDNRDREIRARGTALARVVDKITTSFAFACAILFVAHILVVPGFLWFDWHKKGWKQAAKTGGIILGVDIVVYLVILLLAFLQKQFPSVFGFAEIRRRFDAEHPDFIVVLRPAEGKPGSGDTALFKWPDA